MSSKLKFLTEIYKNCFYLQIKINYIRNKTAINNTYYILHIFCKDGRMKFLDQIFTASNILNPLKEKMYCICKKIITKQNKTKMKQNKTKQNP